VQQLRQTRRRCCWSREPKESLFLAEFDEKWRWWSQAFAVEKLLFPVLFWFLLSPYGCDVNLLV
jgi:hypothetical protein